jgi:hypothetical protein
MNNSIDPIKIIINLRTIAISQKGFSLPILFGGKAPTYFAKLLSGNQGLLFEAKTPGEVFIRVAYIVSGNNTSLSVGRTGAGTENDPYLISVNVATDGSGVATSTASAIKIAAEAVSDVNDIVSISTLGDGSSSVVAVSSTSLAYERYMLIKEVTELSEFGFTSTDEEWKAITKLFSQRNRPTQVALYLVKNYPTIADEIAVLINDGKTGWYKAFTTSRVKANIQSVSTAISAIKGLFFGCTSDLTVLANRTGDREAYLLHTLASEYPELAIIGGLINKEVGSFTYAFKTTSGVGVSGYSNSEQSQILKENPSSDGYGNVVANYSGVPVFFEGKVADGTYIDLIEAADFLEARLREDLAQMNISSDKIDFTPDGLSDYESIITIRMNQLGEQRIIAPVLTNAEREEYGAEKNYKFSIELPDFDSIPVNNKSKRTLPFIRVKAKLAGAIHQGTVEIDLMP